MPPIDRNMSIFGTIMFKILLIVAELTNPASFATIFGTFIILESHFPMRPIDEIADFTPLSNFVAFFTTNCNNFVSGDLSRCFKATPAYCFAIVFTGATGAGSGNSPLRPETASARHG